MKEEKEIIETANLFSDFTKSESDQVRFDNQIQYPIHSTLTQSTIKHLCATNGVLVSCLIIVIHCD